ncbi:MAG: hypothetical protein DU489_07860 [Nitrosomonas sp.]
MYDLSLVFFRSKGTNRRKPAAHKIGYDNIILRETNANIRNIIYWQACGVLGRIAGHAATISDIDRLALNMRYP